MALRARIDLEALGFAGFLSVDALDQRTVIPESPGIYCILWPETGKPEFVAEGTGGKFKGIDPNVPISRLTANWVEGSSILYIGKAAGGKSGKRGIRKRLSEYLDFGEGLPVGHKGGRFIWQIRDSGRLLVCWKPMSSSPEILETEMLQAFTAEHGRLPFANLRH